MAEPATRPEDVVAHVNQVRSEMEAHYAKAQEDGKALRERGGALSSTSTADAEAPAITGQSVVQYLENTINWLNGVASWLNGLWWLFGAQNWAINDIHGYVNTLQGWVSWIEANMEEVNEITAIYNAVVSIVEFVLWIISLF